MSSPDQTFIEARQERYRNAHNSLDVDTLLAWFSEGIYYSDHGIGVAHINKEAIRGLATSIFSSVKDMVFTTVSVMGSREFTAWEWTVEGTIVKEIPGVPFKEGDVFKSIGASLFWWDEGEDDKIKRMAEYSKMF